MWHNQSPRPRNFVSRSRFVVSTIIIMSTSLGKMQHIFLQYFYVHCFFYYMCIYVKPLMLKEYRICNEYKLNYPVFEYCQGKYIYFFADATPLRQKIIFLNYCFTQLNHQSLIYTYGILIVRKRIIDVFKVYFLHTSPSEIHQAGIV